MKEVNLTTKDLVKMGVKRTLIYDLFRKNKWPVLKDCNGWGTKRTYSIEDAAKIMCVKVLNEKLGISVQKAGKLVWEGKL